MMEDILHQLRLVAFPINYKASQVEVGFLNHQHYHQLRVFETLQPCNHLQ